LGPDSKLASVPHARGDEPWDRTVTEKTKLEKQKRILERQLEELNKKK
jgi:hypothetical protein